MARDFRYQEYISGKLTLAGLSLRIPFRLWLDAVYAAFLEAPHEVLEKAAKQLAIEEAKIDPERARATWGLRPEHQAMSKGIGNQGGYGQASALPSMPSGTGRKR